MSFSAETKNSLCALQVKNKCCRMSMLYGMLLFSNTFSESQIKMTTENERTSQLFLRLLASCFGVQANLSISEKKSKDGFRYSSYTILLSDETSCRLIWTAFHPSVIENRKDTEIFFSMLRCTECFRAFSRGVFLSAGSISDPKSGYHLDITAGNCSLAEDFCARLSEEGIAAKHTKRKQSSIIYFKESEAIEDFLTYIGAPQAALSVMNVAIYREIRNNENRRSNCDAANIYKTTGTATKQLRAIHQLRQSGRFESLDPELQETARIREEFPERSLQELATVHEPPISKSGVNHRLKKIVELAEKESENV